MNKMFKINFPKKVDFSHTKKFFECKMIFLQLFLRRLFQLNSKNAID